MKNKIQETFDKYIEYCAYAKGLRAETIRGEKQTFETFLKIMPEIISVEDLLEDNIILFLKRLRTRQRIVGRNTIITGIKDSTVDTYWRRLNRFFKWLVQKEYIKLNPVINLRGELPKYEDDKTLKKNEIERIISAIDLHSTSPFALRRDKAMIFTLLHLGVRKGELLGLQVRDIDFVKNKITIRGEISKSKTTRFLAMNLVLKNHLQEYVEERNKRGYKTQYLWVSSSEDSGFTKHGIKHWVRRLNRLSGVKFHLHQFRHTFACTLAKNNVSVFKIMKLLGHKTLRMTIQYLRSIDSDDLDEDIKQINLDKMI